MSLESLLNTTMRVKNFFRDVTSKPKTYTAKFLATTLLAANMLAATAQDPITISGRVTNNPHGAHPELKMQVWDKYTEYTQENVLDELFTNPEDGTFDLTILGTNTQNINQTQNKAYPNPFNDKINIDFTPKQSADYQISITNILGQTIHQENKQLHAGNTLNLEAQGLGPVGVYFVNITSGTDGASYKIMQNQTNNNLQITTRNHAANDSPILKMGDIQELYLKITGDAQHHDKDTILSFENHTGLDIKVDVIAQEILANYELNATNNPMNAPIQNGFVTAVNEHGDELISQTINNGTAQSTYPQTEWIYANDTIRHTNQITSTITAEHHHTQELFDSYNENLNIETVLEQISYEKTAELNMNFTSAPLMYAPTLDTYILNGTDTIAETNITNGEAQITIPYTEYINGQDTLKHINGEPVSDITILAGNDKHIEQEYNIQFQDDMNLYAEINQTPEQGETTIITNLTGNVFGEAPNGVSLAYRNNDTDELLTQGESVNGEHTAQIPYQYWEHGELYQSTLNQIKQEITKPGVYDAIDEILLNENQTTNYTLTQIPEEKTAQIIGTVKTPAQIPVPGADVEIKHEETQYATTTTLESGEFETTMQYTKYTNPENSEQTITEPTNIYAKITKDTYETTTTEPQSLEDIVNFGDVTLTPEPQLITFNIQPYTATHKHINQITTEPFKFLIRTLSDNAVHEFTQTGTNPVEITLTQYPPTEEIKIWHNNPEQKFDQTIFFENPQGYWTDPTIAQNRIVREWAPGAVMDTTTTTLGHLGNPEWNTHIDAYFPEHTLYSTGPGINLTFSGDTIMTMLADRTGYTNLIKNWKHESIPHLDDITFTYFLWPGDPWNTSLPITQQDLETIHAIKQNMDQYLTSPSGKVRMQINYHQVSNQEDAQEFITRNWNYTHRTWYEGGQPGNAVTLDVPNQRIMRAYATFPLYSIQGDIYEEIKESRLASGNAPGNIASSGYTAKLGDNGYITPNDVGITMIVMQTGLNSWTPVITWNKETQKFEEYKTNNNTTQTKNNTNDPLIKDSDIKENKNYHISIEQNQFNTNENIKYNYEPKK